MTNPLIFGKIFLGHFAPTRKKAARVLKIYMWILLTKNEKKKNLVPSSSTGSATIRQFNLIFNIKHFSIGIIHLILKVC